MTHDISASPSVQLPDHTNYPFRCLDCSRDIETEAETRHKVIDGKLYRVSVKGGKRVCEWCGSENVRRERGG